MPPDLRMGGINHFFFPIGRGRLLLALQRVAIEQLVDGVPSGRAHHPAANSAASVLDAFVDSERKHLGAQAAGRCRC
jgi:hypothetical protein